MKFRELLKRGETGMRGLLRRTAAILPPSQSASALKGMDLQYEFQDIGETILRALRSDELADAIAQALQGRQPPRRIVIRGSALALFLKEGTPVSVARRLTIGSLQSRILFFDMPAALLPSVPQVQRDTLRIEVSLEDPEILHLGDYCDAIDFFHSCSFYDYSIFHDPKGRTDGFFWDFPIEGCIQQKARIYD